MNNNTTYKDSPLGKIPSDWEVKTLGKVAKITSGGTPSRINKSYWGGTIPWITTSLIDFNIINSAEQYITEEGLINSSTKIFPQGTILMALYGQGVTRGKIAILNIEATTNQACAAIILNDNNVDKKYVFQYLVNKYEEIRKLSNTGNQENLNGELVKSIQLHLPPLPEQTRIAEVLSTWDKAISNVQVTIEQVELRNKWLMQELLTGKRRLKGFSGEWKEYKLEYFIEEYNEKPKIGNNYEVFTSAKLGLMKQTDYYGDNRITNREDADYNVLPPNYLTYRSRSDDGLFTFNKNTLGITGLISGYYPVFTIKNGNLDFVLTYCNFFRQKLTKFSIGTSQLVLAMNALKKASFEFPSHEEQTAIAQVLQAAANEVQVLRSKLDKLKEQKKGLMQVLLTGKKRLVV
jgi:type I restriction enzyme S subunit